jgi:hypothetical protein
MKIPSTVKIGWRIYKIEMVEERRDEKGNLLNGEIDFTNHIIYIDKNISEDEKEVTFLHEVRHGIFYGQGHLKWSENEELVSAVSEGSLQLMKDNPKLFT